MKKKTLSLLLLTMPFSHSFAQQPSQSERYMDSINASKVQSIYPQLTKLRESIKADGIPEARVIYGVFKTVTEPSGNPSFLLSAKDSNLEETDLKIMWDYTKLARRMSSPEFTAMNGFVCLPYTLAAMFGETPDYSEFKIKDKEFQTLANNYFQATNIAASLNSIIKTIIENNPKIQTLNKDEKEKITSMMTKYSDGLEIGMKYLLQFFYTKEELSQMLDLCKQIKANPKLYPFNDSTLAGFSSDKAKETIANLTNIGTETFKKRCLEYSKEELAEFNRLKNEISLPETVVYDIDVDDEQ